MCITVVHVDTAESGGGATRWCDGTSEAARHADFSANHHLSKMYNPFGTRSTNCLPIVGSI